MDFELKHLDMIPSQIEKENTVARDYEQSENGHHITKSSLVLQDLMEQIESLQDKLNINYKKLLLFETENKKLLEEKNKFFFEHKTATEELSVVQVKNRNLNSYCDQLESENKGLLVRIDALEKVNATQKADLGRLSKFHLKVKNIIKPFVEDLKKNNTELLDQNLNYKNLILQNEQAVKSYEEKIAKLEEHFDITCSRYETEKTSLINSYEEQIHFLSKEIVNHQQEVLDAQNENIRLKKATETKHFLENEVVRLKRSNDEMLQELNSLKIKQNEKFHENDRLTQELSDLKNQLVQITTENEQNQMVLNSTRQQLTKKLSENEDLHLRIRMLEKLNMNLSLTLQDSNLES